MITFLLDDADAALVALGLSMVPKAAELLARLERMTAMESLLPWPQPPQLLIIERCDGQETVVEYYQDAQVDRINRAIRRAMTPRAKKAKPAEAVA
jgi:hypothetical protein